MVNPVTKVTSTETAIDNLFTSDSTEGEDPIKETPAQEPESEVNEAEEPQEESLEEEIDKQTEEPEEDAEIEHVFFDEWAKEVDLDVQDAYEFSVKLPNEDPMTISELKNFRIDNKDIDDVRENLKQKETELKTQSETLSETPKISNELLQAKAKVMAIQEAYNRVNWQGLRSENPAEWSALQTDYKMQFDLAVANEQRVANDLETHQEQARAFAQARLFEAMPELKDEEVAKQVGNDVVALVARYNFKPDDVAALTNPDLMRLLIDFSKVDKAKTTAKAKKVVVKEAPTKKPSARPIRQSNKARLKRLQEAAKKGTKQDKDDFLTALLT